jgi:hypothetical protein
LEEWKALTILQDQDQVPTTSQQNANVKLYLALEDIVKRRVRNSQEYQRIFKDLKLRLKDVDTTLPSATGWNEFRLHLYLTDGLGRSIEYLCDVSLTTNIFLALSSLFAAMLAHYYQVAFMYFLPGFLGMGILVFVVGFFVSRYMRRLSENDDHNTAAKWMTVRSYCRTIQVCLYCLFFSFCRLLLSNDIYEFYPKIYFAALLALLITLLLVVVFTGEVIKETTCALILPPHVPKEVLKKSLESIVSWHTTESCHECGARQFPVNASLSHEWAGRKPTEDRRTGPPDTHRAFSWRG